MTRRCDGWWVVALTYGLLACGGAQVRHTTPKDPIDQAIALRDAGQLEAADARLEKLAASGDRRALLELAETKMLRGRHAEAVARLRSWWEAEPAHPPLVYAMARALDGAGLGDEAVGAYARHLGKSPRDTAAALRLTELLIDRGDAAGATAVAEAALNIAPQHAALHVALARALISRGRLPSALEHATEATRIAPADAEVWAQLAQVHMVLGDYAKAREALEKALAVDPQHADALRDLGILYVEMGDPARGAAVLERASQAGPGLPQIWLALGVAHQRAGALELAHKALERARTLAPEAVAIAVAQSDLALERGLPLEALAASRTAHKQLNKLTTAELRTRVEQQLVRATVVSVLAAALCGGQRGEAQMLAAIAASLRTDGLEHLASQALAVASQSKAALLVAQKRCTGAAATLPAAPPVTAP